MKDADAPRDPMALWLAAITDPLADAIAARLEHTQGARRRLLDMEQATEYLGTSEDTIHRLIAEGKLVPVRFDRRIRFDIRDLDKLIEQAKHR
jgi:excisionase family DNA binding protein